MRIAVLGCVAAALLPTAPVPTAAATGPAKPMTLTNLTVSVSAGHRSAQGLVPVVVTLNGASRGTSAELGVSAPGLTATCAGRPRFDRVRHTLSRTCHVQVASGHVHLKGTARVQVGDRLVTLRSA